MNQHKHTVVSDYIQTLMRSEAIDVPALQSSEAHYFGHSTELPRYDIVIDACSMRNEIRRYLDIESGRTFIEEVHASRIGQVHAPRWIETELETSVLPKLYKVARVSPRILDRAAEHLLEGIHVHQSYDTPIYENLPNDVDPKDEPYARLARDINALGILSWDNGFSKYEVRAFKEEVVRHIQHLARLSKVKIEIRIAGKSAVVVPAILIGEAAKTAPALIRKVPTPLLIGGSILGLWYLTSTDSGRKNAKKLRNLISAGAKGAFDLYADGHRQLTLADQTIAGLQVKIESEYEQPSSFG